MQLLLILVLAAVLAWAVIKARRQSKKLRASRKRIVAQYRRRLEEAGAESDRQKGDSGSGANVPYKRE